MNTHIYNKIVTSVLAGLLMLAPCLLSSCDEFLDEMPDNRTTIDKEKKVKDILTSAYPDHEYGVVCEFSSDNVDEFNNTNGSSNRWFMQLGHWEDITETFNEGPNNLWTGYYSTAVTANMALEGIENLGGPHNALLTKCKGEALVLRAYAHFMLANIFCKAYDPATAANVLGVYYQYDTGTEVGVVNPRETCRKYMRRLRPTWKRVCRCWTTTTPRPNITSTAKPPMPLPRASTCMQASGISASSMPTSAWARLRRACSATGWLTLNWPPAVQPVR